MIRALAFGDSITYGIGDPAGNGWAGLLQREFSLGGQRLYNLGIPGDTSADVLRRFRQESRARLRRASPADRICVIFGVGANDAKGIGRPENPLVPLPAFRRNLARLTALAKAAARDVVFVGLIPVDEAKVMPFSADDYFSNATFELYNQALREHCRRSRAGFVDMFGSWRSREYRKLLADGLHPNSRGYALMAESVRECLKGLGLR